MLLFKVSHGLRCLYTIDLFKKNLTYINSIIPFLQLLRVFVGVVVSCFVFLDKLSHIKGYLETPDSHTHTHSQRLGEREGARRSRERESTLSKYQLGRGGGLEIRCKDVDSG